MTYLAVQRTVNNNQIFLDLSIRRSLFKLTITTKYITKIDYSTSIILISVVMIKETNFGFRHVLRLGGLLPTEKLLFKQIEFNICNSRKIEFNSYNSRKLAHNSIKF